MVFRHDIQSWSEVRSGDFSTSMYEFGHQRFEYGE